MADDSVRPGGMACTIGAWDPGTFYPGRTSRTLTLTEFADPELQLIYLHVPDPEDDRLRDDELLAEPE